MIRLGVVVGRIVGRIEAMNDNEKGCRGPTRDAPRPALSRGTADAASEKKSASGKRAASTAGECRRTVEGEDSVADG